MATSLQAEPTNVVSCAQAHIGFSYASLICAAFNDQQGEIVMNETAKIIRSTFLGTALFFVAGVGVGLAQAAIQGL